MSVHTVDLECCLCDVRDVCADGNFDALLAAYPVLCVTYSCPDCPAFDGLTRELFADAPNSRWRGVSVPTYGIDLGCGAGGTHFVATDKGPDSFNTTNYTATKGPPLTTTSMSPLLWSFDTTMTTAFDYYGCGLSFPIHITIVPGACP